MKDLVSIVIPLYNHSETIRYCLETAVMQSYDQPIEIIVINDGSTDNSLEVVEQSLKDNPDWKQYIIKVISQENKGAPAARNFGAKEASGEFIIFIDADTVCYPKMIAEMRRALEKNTAASFAYSQFRYGAKKIQSHEFDKHLLQKINYIDTTSLIRRADFSGFDEALKRFQDWDLWLTMTEQNKIGVFVEEVLFRKKLSRTHKGMSSWLPSFVYKLPWKIQRVKDYETAKNIVLIKHGLR